MDTFLGLGLVFIGLWLVADAISDVAKQMRYANVLRSAELKAADITVDDVK
jgi:hypothetical protein